MLRLTVAFGVTKAAKAWVCRSRSKSGKKNRPMTILHFGQSDEAG